MDAAFTRAYGAAVREQPVVFGLRLKPFTLGHVFLLEAMNSPLVSFQGGRELGFEEIGAAVFACAHEPAEAVRNFKKWWFRGFAWLWGKRARPEWWTVDYPEFREYLATGLSGPGLRPAKDGGRQCESPGPWVKLFFAMHVLHLGRDEAMAMEMAELNVLYAVWAEFTGNGELRDNSRLEALLRYAEEQDAKRFNDDGTRKGALKVERN